MQERYIFINPNLQESKKMQKITMLHYVILECYFIRKVFLRKNIFKTARLFEFYNRNGKTKNSYYILFTRLVRARSILHYKEAAFFQEGYLQCC